MSYVTHEFKKIRDELSMLSNEAIATLVLADAIAGLNPDGLDKIAQALRYLEPKT